MKWSRVGDWLKTNGGSGLSLVGSMLSGNVPGAIAAGAALAQSATGKTDPSEILDMLQTDPVTRVRLAELASADAASIRAHIEAMERIAAEDEQRRHAEQQQTIRTGDTAADEYVRHTRPMMARASFWVGTLYALGFELLGAFDVGGGADPVLLATLLAPAGAYLGFRTWDKGHAAREAIGRAQLATR